MSVKLVVAVTDSEWFDQLRVQPDLADVNFWAPSGGHAFRVLEPGELFLFKLRAPRNFIVGGGVFVHSNTMPCSLAWEAFGEANGARSLEEMRQRIARLRADNPRAQTDFQIGCRILNQPFFFSESDWIPAPPSVARAYGPIKSYSTDESEGRRLWEAVQQRLAGKAPTRMRAKDERERFGEPVLVRPRLGQGAFRILVTDLYRRRCAITKERTLPALEAAHIRPYSEGGSHEPTNGLLLRRDIHSLFDAGYVTVTPEHRFEVSKRIREEYENGRMYYALDGEKIDVPLRSEQRPDRNALTWHNTVRFRG